MRPLLGLGVCVRPLLGLGVALAACHGDAAGIAWMTNADTALAQAKAEHRPVLIEFTADWCVPCKELEAKTYPDAAVRAAAERFVMLRIDATERTDAVEALFERYHVSGLPTLLFVDTAGAVLATPRLSGFVPPAELVAMMAAVP